MKKILCAFLSALIVLFISACGVDKIVWSDVVLGNTLPTPPKSEGEIHSNSSEALWIDIDNISDKEFADYVNACKEKGFTVDAQSTSSSYEAFNSDGYKLSLGHYGSDADMRIRLETPMEFTAITWPTSTAGQLLPPPRIYNRQIFVRI